MLVTWMAYATLFSGLVALGALALDKLVDIWNGPRRAVWTIALVTASVVPVLLAVRRAPAPPATEYARIVLTGADLAALRGTSSSVHIAAPPKERRYDFAAWNRPIAATWIAASIALVALGFGGVARVARRRRAWRRANVAGEPVLLARDAGPAVIGTLRPRIVLPEWALALGDDDRTLILKHETEHVRARDPLLLALAGLFVVLFPWNAALWFAAQRLRLAIEIDCDARVLRAVDRPREYGLLLLAVGARRTVSLPLAASLAERRPLLEWRIRAMTAVRPSKPFIASLPFAAVVVAAASVAAQTPRPAPIPLDAPAAPVVASAPMAAPAAAPVAAAAPTAAVAAAPKLSAAPKAPPMLALAAPSTPAIAPVPAAIAAPSDVPMPALAPSTSARVVVARSGPDSIPVAVLQTWIAQFHPTLVLGDTSLDRVTFLVDANGNYVKSIADKSPRETVRNVVVRRAGGRTFSADTVEFEAASAVLRAKLDSGVAGFGRGGAAPSTVTDEQGRPKTVGGAPAGAILRARGSVPGAQMASAAGPIDQLGIAGAAIDNVQVLHFPEGVVVPTAINITVVRLKP